MRLNEWASAATSSPPVSGAAWRRRARSERLRGELQRAQASPRRAEDEQRHPERARHEQPEPRGDQRRAVLADDRVERPFARRQADDGDDAAVDPDARDARPKTFERASHPAASRHRARLRAF